MSRGAGRKRDALCDDSLSFEADPYAVLFVKLHPHGATLEEVASMFDITRERVRQIEARALHKLAMVCEERGISLASLLGPPQYTYEEERVCHQI